MISPGEHGGGLQTDTIRGTRGGQLVIGGKLGRRIKGRTTGGHWEAGEEEQGVEK